MTDLDQYLDRATRGLYGARRRTVREELHGNLVQQALDFQVSGFSPDEALCKALHAFGPPARVSRSLLQVHTLPLIVTGLLVASSLSTVALGVAVHEAASRQTSPARPRQDNVNPPREEVRAVPSSPGKGRR